MREEEGEGGDGGETEVVLAEEEEELESPEGEDVRGGGGEMTLNGGLRGAFTLICIKK